MSSSLSVTNPRGKKRFGDKIDLILVAAIVIGTAVRVWKFGEIPPGLNQDEASTALSVAMKKYPLVAKSGYPVLAG